MSMFQEFDFDRSLSYQSEKIATKTLSMASEFFAEELKKSTQTNPLLISEPDYVDFGYITQSTPPTAPLNRRTPSGNSTDLGNHIADGD